MEVKIDYSHKIKVSKCQVYKNLRNSWDVTRPQPQAYKILKKLGTM
jgi:hypothetical protein